jgi:dipeptidyl-peptidase-4
MRAGHRHDTVAGMSTVDFPRQLARTRRFSSGAPFQVTMPADGSIVLFLRSRGGDDPVACLWAFEPDTGTTRLLADPYQLTGTRHPDSSTDDTLAPEERTRRERARQLASGIVSFAIDAAARHATFDHEGRLYRVDVATAAVHLLPVEGAVDARLDPTGARVAYVRDGAVRVIEADGTRDRPVLTPDGPDVLCGLAEHVAAESMGRWRGYWWSPDGTRLLVSRVDNSRVGVWYLADPANPDRPPRALRYPVAGTANADVTLWLVDVDGGTDVDGGDRRGRVVVDWDRAAFEYLTAAGWDEHGPFAAVQSRDQRTLRVLGIDPSDGATRVLAEERDATWVRLVPGTPARTGSGALVRTVADADTRRLMVGDVAVTPPGTQVEAVLGVDGDRILFAATTDPVESHLWSYDPVGGLARISAEPGMHIGVLAADTVIHIGHTEDRPGARTTVLRNGVRAGAIASYAEDPVLAARPVFLRVGARDLRVALFLPSWHRPGSGLLPVLLDPYGGPATRKVTRERAPWVLVSQWFAEQGFAVVVADGRGTPGRGPAWENEIWGDLAGPVLDDQVDALRETAGRHPDLDLTRVGVRGWSFGGYLAALAVLRRPDVFHAAVAGAPVVDQRWYDTHWKERFLGHPDAYPEHYERSSLLAEAASLSRPLLLIHGLLDDNVAVAHTLRLSTALAAAGRPHEVLALAGTTHLPADPALVEHLLTYQRDFLRRTLGCGAPAAGGDVHRAGADVHRVGGGPPPPSPPGPSRS